jgi:transposase
MKVVGCDVHLGHQQSSVVETFFGGEGVEVEPSGRRSQAVYRELEVPVLIGIEAAGNSDRFVGLVRRFGHGVGVGDAAQIRASYVRKQMTDKRDAGHILKRLIEGRFPEVANQTLAGTLS